MTKHIIYCDSGLKEFCMVVDEVNPIIRLHPGKVTVNEGEYYAVIASIEYAVDEQWDDVEIYTDSLLVVSQFNGQWKCKKKHLRQLRNLARDLGRMITKLKVEHVPREKNLAGIILENR